MKSTSERAARAGGLRGARDLRAIDRSIAVVLRWGIIVSAVIIVAGIALFIGRSGIRVILLAPPGIPPGEHTSPTSLQAVLQDLNPHHPSAVTDLGLLMLIATPVAGVAIATAAFGIDRDWTYFGVGALVFALLMVSFMLGKA